MLADKSHEISGETREDFMLGALCGGVAINTTGTGFPHPMGYNLTLLHGLPHGQACAVFICEYLKLSAQAAPPGLIKDMLAAFGAPLEQICETISALTDYNMKFDDETLNFYVSKISGVKNYTNSYMQITDDMAFRIYKKCVGR
jgi:alcohol dehydrogenase class IV